MSFPRGADPTAFQEHGRDGARELRRKLMLRDYEPFFELIVGKLADEGWPEPYAKNWHSFMPEQFVIWRESEKGNCVSLGVQRPSHGGPPRFDIRLQILRQERYVMIDLPVLPIWPGDHDALTLIEVLRCFRSVIDPKCRRPEEGQK